MESHTRKNEVLPRWAPKVSQSLIRRLYLRMSEGIEDDELVDEVGLSLFARCKSILTVTDAVKGRIICPVCQKVFDREKTMLVCPSCGWTLSWHRFKSTYKDRQLFGGGALDAFLHYYNRYPAASTSRKRLLLIDQLLHEYHWNLIAGNTEPLPTRPAAACLIEGKGLADVIHFLDELSGVPSDDPERLENIRLWYKNSRQKS